MVSLFTIKAENRSGFKFFPLEQIKPGMKAVSRTVFSGSRPEEFNVEILGVLPGYPGPRQSMIIARLSGGQVDRTGVFAGMSGSPVFIDGRLAGAIAFSFPFSKEPIAGITPIEQMLGIFEQGMAVKPAVRRVRAFSIAELMGTLNLELPEPLVKPSALFSQVSGAPALASLVGQQLSPIATPLVFSGFASAAVSHFGPKLQEHGLLPVSGAGGSARISPLSPSNEETLGPGTSVSVQLVRGDFSIAAAGTVTYRDGNQIYAFGHPFLGLGSSEMPMTEASVVSVVPNTMNSFKLSVPGNLVGAISQDRSTGIYGKLGHTPEMIPVRINLKTSRNKTEEFRFEVARDTFLTPLLLNMATYSSILSLERGIGDSTISISGKIGVKGQSDIEISRRFSSANSAASAALSVAIPVAALLSSGFKDVKLDEISLDITSTDEKLVGILERVAVDKVDVRRGESLEIQAYIRTESGDQSVQRIPLQIPMDVPAGPLTVFIGDGNALQQASASQWIAPKDLSQLVTSINKLKKNDRLYVKLFRTTPGVMIGTDELPNLPPSVVATLNSDRTSGGHTATAMSPIFEKELPPAEFVVVGQQLVSLNVTR
jgi:hypothetical protein